MMWALEYDPDLYTQYEESDSERPEDAKGKPKSSKQCGKFEREYLRSGAKVGEPLPISVFLVASVLKEKSVKLLTEAKGLDDVVKVKKLLISYKNKLFMQLCNFCIASQGSLQRFYWVHSVWFGFLFS